MADITNEINNRCPFCARISLNDGGGHFVAIYGFNSYLNMVAVGDPWYDASDVKLSVFQTAYKGTGLWDGQYFTKP